MSRTETGSRDRIVKASLALLRQGGLAASGVNSVVLAGDAPKGSVYHYFPGGKTEIVLEALERNRIHTEAALRHYLGSNHSLPRRVNALFRDLAARMSSDAFTSSCAIGTVTLDIGAEESSLREACGRTLDGWVVLVAGMLPELPPARRRAAAQFFISLLEGAQLAARATRSASPIENAAQAFLVYAKSMQRP